METNKISGPTILYIGLTIAVLITIYFVLRGLGLIKTKEEKAINDRVDKVINIDYWESNYFKSVQANLKKTEKILLNTQKNLDVISDKIHEAFGMLDDDEASIYAIFKNNLSTKVKISQIEDYYAKANLSLITQLRDKLNDSEIKMLLSITDNLPVGIYSISTGKLIR